MNTIALIFALAVLVEGLVEYFGTTIPGVLKPFVAAAIGVLLCVAYQADLLATLGYEAVVPFVGSVLTGLIIGRGSNYLNDLVSTLQVSTSSIRTMFISPARKPISQADIDAGK